MFNFMFNEKHTKKIITCLPTLNLHKHVVHIAWQVRGRPVDMWWVEPMFFLWWQVIFLQSGVKQIIKFQIYMHFTKNNVTQTHTKNIIQNLRGYFLETVANIFNPDSPLWHIPTKTQSTPSKGVICHDSWGSCMVFNNWSFI